MQQEAANRRKPVHDVTKPPPGTIVSAFGVRQYHTLESPVGGKKTHRTEPAPAKANTWPVRESSELQKSEPANQTQATTTQEPKSNQQLESGTQTEAVPVAVTTQTQTDDNASNKISQPKAAIIDAATSPINMASPTTRAAPRASHDRQSAVTEDYRNVLSRHSDDFWDDRRSVSIILPDSEVGDVPTPFPSKNVAVMTERKYLLPNKMLNAAQQTDLDEIVYTQKHTRSTQAAIPLSTIAYKNASPRRVVIQRQPVQQPQQIIVVQQEDRSESDDEPAEYHYGPYNQRLSGPPGYHGNPYQHGYNFPSHMHPMQSQQHITPQHLGSSQKDVQLEYGRITSGMGSLELPYEVQQELFREYGHINKTTVTIVSQNGNYSIHSHRR